MNASWFSAIRQFNNTIRNLCGVFGVPSAVARDMQRGIASGALSHVDAMAISKASYLLRVQVGF